MNVRDKGALRVCYFGTYSMEEGYPRNRVIIEGLRRNGVEVIECHEDFWKGTAEKLEGVKAGQVMLKALSRLLLVYGRLITKFRQAGDYDAIIVGYAGHIDIFLARFLNLFRRKPIIFDAFLSLYDTAVMDRRVVSPESLKAKLLRLVDTWSCRVADVVLLDTQAHIDYFVQEFHISSEKFFAVPVGSSLTIASTPSPVSPSPLPPPVKGGGMSSDLPSLGGREIREGGMSSGFPFLGGRGLRGGGGMENRNINVLYFGSYIPLHGVDIILKAAKIIEEKERDTVFTLIGEGQLLQEMKQLASDLRLKSVNFIDRFVNEGELTQYIRQADICLGIFGQTDKAMRVIPCKVYNCLAMGKPLITAATPATKGILIHLDNALLCRSGGPEDLAEAISLLKNDPALRERIARRGQEYFWKNFSVEVIGKKVMHIVESVL